jgi:hypothetical protein
MRAMLLLAAVVAAGCSASSKGLTAASFAPKPGWHVGAMRTIACPGTRGCRQTASWAATASWRDCPLCAGAEKTLRHVDRDGVVIYLTLVKERFRFRRALQWPPRLSRTDVVSPVEGHAARFGLISRGGRLHGYSAGLYIWFGRPHPTREQVSRAQTELETAKLP